MALMHPADTDKKNKKQLHKVKLLHQQIRYYIKILFIHNEQNNRQCHAKSTQPSTLRGTVK